jgi:hypothetical protein
MIGATSREKEIAGGSSGVDQTEFAASTTKTTRPQHLVFGILSPGRDYTLALPQPQE